MPEAWARDGQRRRAAGVPTDVEFRPKWQIALEQIVRLQADGVSAAPVIADAGYGVVTAFRDQLTAAAIPYAVGMTGETTVWPPERAPVLPKRYGGRGCPPSVVRRTARRRPCSALALAQQLPATAWRRAPKNGC